MISRFKESSLKLSVIAVCLLIITGCVSLTDPAAEEKVFEESLRDGLLTHEDVVDILEGEGLKLERITAVSPVKEISVEPESYSIGAGEQLFVYQFDSISSRAEELPFIATSRQTDPCDGDTCHVTLYAKNIVLVFAYAVNEERPFPEITELFEVLNEAVFYEMNDINETVYKGEGEHWSVEKQIDYFKYDWEDGKGEQQSEYFGRFKIVLEYLDEDYENVTEIRYSYEYKDGGSFGSSYDTGASGDSVLDEDGFFSPYYYYELLKQPDQELIELILTWNGNEEKVNLKKKA